MCETQQERVRGCIIPGVNPGDYATLWRFLSSTPLLPISFCPSICLLLSLHSSRSEETVCRDTTHILFCFLAGFRICAWKIMFPFSQREYIPLTECCVKWICAQWRSVSVALQLLFSHEHETLNDRCTLISCVRYRLTIPVALMCWRIFESWTMTCCWGAAQRERETC